MPRVLRKGQKVQGRRAGTGLPPAEEAPAAGVSAPGVRRARQVDAIRLLLGRPIRTGTGTRICVYGATEKGKSWFSRAYIAEVLRSGVAEVVIAHDVKIPSKPMYQGHFVQSDEDLAQVLDSDPLPPIIVARGTCTADACAVAVRTLAEAGIKAMLWIDETDTAKESATAFPESIDWIFTRGAGVGASVGALVQNPQSMPTKAMDQSPQWTVFGVGGRSLAYMLDKQLIPRGCTEELVRKLQPGELVIGSNEEDWDATIYGPT